MGQKHPWRTTVRRTAFLGALIYACLAGFSFILGQKSAPAGESTTPLIQQNSTGDCSPNINGNGNTTTTNCNTKPRISASPQKQSQSNNPAMPWQTTFTISTTAPIQAGSLKLTCSGPCLQAGIERISNFELVSGSNGPVPGDPNTVLYELKPEPLSAGRSVSVAVYSANPVTVVSGSIGDYPIEFPAQ
jgi:hypothetical protein